jgi:Insertion element 4 transposase N-terminal/Transposase DDE domain
LPVESDTCRVVREVTVAAGRFAPGHLGELTRIVPFEMVDAVLVATARVQRRVRDLPSRVVVYLLLAAGLFEGCGYRQVWARLVAALDRLPVATPTASALAAARRRVGAAPLAALFDLLRGPVAGPATAGVWWHRRLLVALDGTSLCCPDTAANLAVYRKGGGYQGGTGYPMVRLAALVACGTRALLAAVFGPTNIDERDYAGRLLSDLHPGMLVLADRNFGYRPMLTALAGTGADLLVRVKNRHRWPVCRRCADGSWISRIGPVEVRIICATITVTTAAGRRSEAYRLVSTVLDTDVAAAELVRLYHQRWEIETAYLELKSTVLGGRVLRARTPAGLEQELYALLVTYQALRIAICDATIGSPDIDPDRGSFTVALNAARDQVIEAAGVIASSAGDLIGAVGQQVLDHLLPNRRFRTSPRVVKRAISKHAAHAHSGRFHGPSYNATIRIEILTDPDP